MRNRIRSSVLLAVASLSMSVVAGPASAQVIERIEINQVGDEAEIQIQFIARIQYLRQAPLKNGDVRIYFNLLEVDALDPRLVPETKDAPPSEIAPHFTVTYPELDSSLTIRFGKVVDYHVRPGSDGRSISIFTPALRLKNELTSKAPPIASTIAVTPAIIPPAVVPAVPVAGKSAPPPPQVVAPAPPQAEPIGILPPATPASPEAIEREAKQLIGNARDALQRGQVVTAIETLNRLLNLPPNQQSQVAQALVGEAREKNGEFAKARVEYELYLKLYPKAADTKQVKERLVRLPKEEAKQAQVPPRAQKQMAEEKMIVFGSFSQNYYKGMSHTDITTANGLGVTTATLTSNDQSQLISSLDMTGRKRTETTDTRLVVRDTHTANFLAKQKTNSNRLNTAYVEQSARDRSYLYRLGRQTGSSGGLPGRFDGGLLSYNLNPTWRVNGVLGRPVEFTGGGVERKTFAGMSVDLTRLPEQWSGSGYFIEQRVGGTTDRRAVGVETRYFDTRRNYTGLLDYDTLFKAVNIAMFQGNWMTDVGGSYFFLVDHRKSPPLQLTNALPGQAIQSVDALVKSGVSKDVLRADAQALSANSNLLMVGMNHPYSSHLQLGGDFRITNTSGTGVSGTLPAAPGTGNTYVYSVQAIGNNLLLENDLGVASASYIDARGYKGQSLTFTQVELFRQRWRMDLALQLYNQKDNLGVHITRITPSLKLSYHMSDSVSFEGEGGVEDTHTSSITQNEKIRRKYFYVGYRWDFQ